MKNLKGMTVAVVGMKRSGVAAAELLRQRGAVVRAIDETPSEGVLPQSVESFDGVSLVVLSPGVPADLPVLESVREKAVVIGEVELAFWFLKGGTIGVTGSNGKTTTTALTAHILQASGIPMQVGGNIGVAPTSMVATSRVDQWNVLELSSFQLETIVQFVADIAVCLNVTPDHLDRHYTMERYVEAKGRLFDNQTPHGYAVLNADDPYCIGYGAITRARPVWFSLSHPVAPGLWLEEGKILFDGDLLMPQKDVPLRGLHNIENTMAASAAARLAGASLQQIANAVRSFPGVEHRLEFVRERNGVRYYNDSKATNVDATIKALDSFEGGLWIILGGKDKNSDYALLTDRLLQKARGVLLIGAAASIIAAQIGNSVPVIPCGTLEAAVERAARDAAAGDTVLLSPACASFDQFENYEHRGRVFKESVRAL